MWTDELFTYGTVARPVREIIPIVQHDIHPPLYYVLLHAWMQIPLPWHGVAALRAFSALWALAATLLLDCLFTRKWKPWRRWLVLSLFALSPCLLLYGRMARSYSMQTALTVLAAGMLWRWVRQPEWSLRRGTAAMLALLALLYTHYVPGIALLGAFCAVALRPLGFRRLGLLLAAVSAGYLPWVLTLGEGLRAWGQAAGFSSRYTLSRNALTEQFLKAGFGAVSLTIGETFSVVSLALVPVALVLAWRGIRSRTTDRRFVAFIGLAAGVGYLGVARWVSFPFIPARLLWLLPFLVLAMALGILRLRTPWRQVATAALLISHLSSTVLYFRRENYLNLSYSVPLDEIGERLNREAAPGDLILLDAYNTDRALCHYLSGRTPFLILHAGMAQAARARSAQAGAIWMVRNTRDISPGHISSRVEAACCAGRLRQVAFLQPYAPWQIAAMDLLGSKPLPSYFYQLTVCRGPER